MHISPSLKLMNNEKCLTLTMRYSRLCLLTKSVNSWLHQSPVSYEAERISHNLQHLDLFHGKEGVIITLPYRLNSADTVLNTLLSIYSTQKILNIYND